MQLRLCLLDTLAVFPDTQQNTVVLTNDLFHFICLNLLRTDISMGTCILRNTADGYRKISIDGRACLPTLIMPETSTRKTSRLQNDVSLRSVGSIVVHLSAVEGGT